VPGFNAPPDMMGCPGVVGCEALPPVAGRADVTGFAVPALAGRAELAGAGFAWAPAFDCPEAAGVCPKASPVANVPTARVHKAALVRIVNFPFRK
jgi:hypothetical protein